jgi:hypothetical protein
MASPYSEFICKIISLELEFCCLIYYTDFSGSYVECGETLTKNVLSSIDS